MNQVNLTQAVPNATPPTSTPPADAFVAPIVEIMNVDTYKAVMMAVQTKLKELVAEGSMSDYTASRVLADLEFTYFQQLVKVQVQLP